MSDVFVSYSRRDSEFVTRLAGGLTARGKDVWVDTDGLRDGEVFPLALRNAIEGSDGFVFVISPDSVSSRYCADEVEHALALNKRIVPLVHRSVPDEAIPEPIRVRNWIPFTDFDGGLQRVVDALDTDLAYTKEHTRWLLKALEWEDEGRDRSFLLRGAELTAAEPWITESAGREPEPTALQREYVQLSRAAGTRRLRTLLGVTGVALVVAVALSVLALTQRNEARQQTAVAQQQSENARAHEIAALSEAQLAFDPELAILLARESVRTQATPQGMLALRRAIDGSALRMTLTTKDTVNDIAFSPDGRTLATTSNQGPLRVWDGRTGKLRQTLPAQPRALEISTDGKSVAGASATSGVVFYDPASGREQRAAPESAGELWSVTYSRNGRWMATGGNNFARLWDARTLEPRAPLKTASPVYLVDVSQDGRWLAASSDHSGAYLWDTRTGRQVGHNGREAYPGIAISPDGRRFAYGAAELRLVDTANGRVVKRIAGPADGTFLSLDYSPDGTLLAGGSTDGIVRLWDAETGEPITSYRGHRCCVNTVRFNADGSLLGTTSKDGTAKLWSTHGSELALARAGEGAVKAVAFTGDRVLTASNGETTLWTVGAAEPEPVPGARDAADVAAAGTTAAVLDGSVVRLLDARTGRVQRTISDNSENTAVALSADGRHVAVGGLTAATVFDATTGAGAERSPIIRTRDLAFGPGTALAFAGQSDRETGAVSVWRSGQTKPSWAAADPNVLDRVAYAGNLVAGSAQGDSIVRVWDTKRRALVRQLLGHSDKLTGIAFSPDGSLLATSSLDRTARIWDAHTGRELRVLQHDQPVTAIAFSADGGRVVTGDQKGIVHVWDACTGCLDPRALLALAKQRVTRQLTPLERATLLRETR